MNESQRERDLEALNAYVDGALDAAARAAIERRLESDAELREQLVDLRALDRSLGAMPRPASLAGSDDALIERLRGAPSFPESRISWPILIGLTIAVLAALLVLAAVSDEIASRLAPQPQTAAPPVVKKNLGKKGPPGLATITFARGDATIYSPASKGGDAAKSGGRWMAGSTLATSDASNVIVTLDGGGVLHVFERSQLALATDHSFKFYEGDAVATNSAGSPVEIAAEGVTVKLDSGACEFAYEDLLNQKFKGSRRLRVTLLAGAASIGDVKLVPGETAYVQDGAIVR